MIRGYFLTEGGRARPFVDAVFRFPSLPARPFRVPLLVDTGADRTLIGPFDAQALQREFELELGRLPRGPRSTGVGGSVDTRAIDALIQLDAFSLPLRLTILDQPPGAPLLRLPSLLGRDVLSQFALFFEERTGRVLLLEPHEADALNLS